MRKHNTPSVSGAVQRNSIYGTPPADFAATEDGADKIVLTWDNDDADFVHMQIQAEVDGDWITIANSLDMETETIDHEELDAATEYKYRYRIYHRTLWGPWSQPIPETTGA